MFHKRPVKKPPIWEVYHFWMVLIHISERLKWRALKPNKAKTKK